MALNGYDESSFQGDINNALVPGDFDIIKATEGVGYTDADCDPNFQQAKAAGKLLGFYHFGRPDGNDPISEANWFVSQTSGYFGQGVPVLDLEVNPTSPVWAKAWLDRVYDLTKVRAWLYMNQARFNTGDWSAVWPNYAAWVASYGMNNQQNGYGDPNAPVTINGDWTIVATQYTSQGILPGWGGDLDLNIAYIDRAGWQKYVDGDRNVTPAPAPAPAPTQTPAPTPAPVVVPAPTAAQTSTTPPTVTVTTPIVVPVTQTPSTTQVVPVTAPTAPVVQYVPAAPKTNWLVQFILAVLKALRLKK